jgi:sortase (surface protein transpeptidase)
VVSAALKPAVPVAAPVRLDYEAIGADVPVVPTGVAGDGQMEIPEDASVAGWYRFGPAPADGEGNTVIAAHAGSAQTPEGPLYGLRNARPGEAVRVEDTSGQHHAYRVTTVDQRGKDGLDLTPYFTRSGPGRLVLVTCGGQWLPERQSYADNIIVVAEPVD